MYPTSTYSRKNKLPVWFYSHSITITSETGVGKSVTMERLQHDLGMPWRFVSGGSIMRMFAAQKKMTIEQFAEHCRKHPEENWDDQCDQCLSLFGTHNYVVTEGRLPHIFVSTAFHVHLECDLDIRARRRHGAVIKRDPTALLCDVRDAIEKRDRDDRARYSELYPGYQWPNEDFDLCIDTAAHNIDRVIELIREGHERWKKDLGQKIHEGARHHFYDPAHERY